MPNYVINNLIIKGSPEVIKNLKERVVGDDTPFDFDRIIPMPDTLNIVAGGHQDEAIVAYLSDNCTKPLTSVLRAACEKRGVSNRFSTDWIKEIYSRTKARIDEDGTDKKYDFRSDFSSPINKDLTLFDAGKIYVTNVDKYGAPTWYEWHCNNWGCKWNCSDASLEEIADNHIEYWFTTPWSCPEPIFEALANEFPTLRFQLKYADEDIGSDNCGKLFWDPKTKEFREWHPANRRGCVAFANQLW